MNIVNLAEITTEKATTEIEAVPGSEIIGAKKNTMTMAEAVKNTSTVQENLAHEEKAIHGQNEGMTWNAEEQNVQAKRIWNAKDPDTDAIISTLHTLTVIFFFSFLLMYIL